ncbi:MAG: hypothetical protein KGL53_14870 [Elusimicrobia bacterium]|nr:hypothetical protein [Elusimicrobiota bacterium]
MNTVLVGIATSSAAQGMGGVREGTVTVLFVLGLIVLAAGLWTLWRGPRCGGAYLPPVDDPSWNSASTRS